MLLVDSHCHIQSQRFDADRAEVLASARGSGVERLLAPGWDLESSRASLALARAEGTDASAGIHPHAATDVDDAAWAAIVELASDPLAVAVGETGLDYDRGFAPRDDQLANLRRHLVLGHELGKPVILHCRSKPGARDAHDDLLRELADAGAPAALLHSFSGPVDYGERALDMGLAVSFSGLVFRAGEEASATMAGIVPADRLLIETDSPYLSAPGADRRRNEPRWVAITAGWLARTRGDDPDALGVQLVANYDRIFSRPPS